MHHCSSFCTCENVIFIIFRVFHPHFVTKKFDMLGCKGQCGEQSETCSTLVAVSPCCLDLLLHLTYSAALQSFGASPTGPGLYSVRLYGVRLYDGAVQNRTLRREKPTRREKNRTIRREILLFFYFSLIFLIFLFLNNFDNLA